MQGALLKGVLGGGLLLFATFAFAEDFAVCSTPTNSFDEIKAQRPCEAEGLAGVENSCAKKAQRFTDPAAVRARMIESLRNLDASEFQADAYERSAWRGSGVREALGSFNHSIKRGTAERTKLMERLVDQYLERNNDYRCENGAKFIVSNFFIPDGTRKTYFTSDVERSKKGQGSLTQKNEYEKTHPGVLAEKMNQQIAAVDQVIKEKFGSPSQQIEKMISCTGAKTEPKAVQYTAVGDKNCVSHARGFYKDNQWEGDFSQFVPDPEFDRCIKDKTSKGAKIERLEIRSSSSLLNNTNVGFPAASFFCEKGFAELSAARAKDVQSRLLPKMFTGSDSEGLIQNAKIHAKGSNKDGTSGACPYKLVNGKEVLLPEYAEGGSKRSELDQSKYVDIHVVFDSKWTALNTPEEFIVDGGCRSVTLQCR
jgi:hypothetical protein